MSRGEDDGFLGRWSRLKRQTETPEPEPEPEREPAPVPGELAPDTRAPAGPELLSEEELAALPRIEDLTEGSDIRPFLRFGVPRQLRNAAMRRMWMLTPGIRDYRDPALDYAGDWNAPGGVPGGGIAPAPERAAEMLRNLLLPRERIGRTDRTEDEPGIPDRQPVGPPEVQDAAASFVTESTDAFERKEVQKDDAGEIDLPPRRRHGSALPG